MNLFGEKNISKSINIAIFTDERKNISDTWNYISSIIIPTKKFNSLYDDLMSHRATVDYYNELKFSEINNIGKKAELGKLWLSEILNDMDERIYFNILGLNRKILDENKFGSGSLRKGANYANLYNRFFRTNILAIKYYFGNYDNIIVDKIFHDKEGNLEKHDYFDWHSIWKLNHEKGIYNRFSTICFVDSDHKKEHRHPKASQIVQFSDLLIGTVSHCLDFERKRHKGKNELGFVLYPLIERILKSPMNRNSSYRYYKKYDINFFPNSKYSEFNHLEQYIDKDRKILFGKLFAEIEDEKNGQYRLFK